MKEKVNNEIDLVQDSSSNNSNINIDIDHVNNIAAIVLLQNNQLQNNQLQDNQSQADQLQSNQLQDNCLQGNQLDSSDGSSDNSNGSFSNDSKVSSTNSHSVERTISSYQLKMSGKTYVLYEGENIIGRASANEIFVENQFVSRRHAVINVDGDSLTITDYSKNGTFVNDYKIFEPTELSINDTIAIAKGHKYVLVQVETQQSQQTNTVVKPDIAKGDIAKNDAIKSVENDLVISGLVAETELVQRLSRFNNLSSRLGSRSIVGNNSNRFGVNAGFSLIELLIVIVIVGIIAAISVPNLLTTKRSANSASAIQTLRLISSSQASYSASIGNGEYATVDDLVREQYIDSGIGAASIPSSSPTQQPKSGYIFVFNRVSSNPSTNTLANYGVSARPLFTNGLVASGNKSFFVDSSAVIRFSPSPTPPFADANSQPLN